MKITTWNINGLRAALKKNIDEFFLDEKSDVICLQEIKARKDQLSDQQINKIASLGKEAFWNSADRPGYSGVLTITSADHVETIYGMGDQRFDSEGRLTQVRFDDFRLFNIYFPNGQRDQERLDYKLDFYAHLLEYCDTLLAAGESIVLCGDFNTAHQEIDLKNPKQNKNTSGFMQIERDWVSKYLDHGFVDIFRHLYPDRVQYSWWTYRYGARQRNIGWRLDYFLISKSLVDLVEDVVISDHILGSDHCPVSLIFRNQS